MTDETDVRQWSNDDPCPDPSLPRTDWIADVRRISNGYPTVHPFLPHSLQRLWLANHCVHFCDYTEMSQHSEDARTLLDYIATTGGSHIGAGLTDELFDTDRLRYWDILFAMARFHAYLEELLGDELHDEREWRCDASPRYR